MKPIEKLAMNRTLRMCDIPNGELETLFSEPFQQAGYTESVRAVINANNWWPCYVWGVLEFLNINE